MHSSPKMRQTAVRASIGGGYRVGVVHIVHAQSMLPQKSGTLSTSPKCLNTQVVKSKLEG